jgi:hypothetical protein
LKCIAVCGIVGVALDIGIANEAAWQGRLIRWGSGGCTAAHLANPDPTKFVRRYRRWLVTIGYASGVRAASKGAGGVVAQANRPKAIVALDNGMAQETPKIAVIRT